MPSTPRTSFTSRKDKKKVPTPNTRAKTSTASTPPGTAVSISLTTPRTPKDIGTLAGSVVVVAKCPIPGESKTRLIPLAGMKGSAQLATAMLADVLTALTMMETPQNRAVDRILLYAPPTPEARELMEDLLDRHGIPRQNGPGTGSSSTPASSSSRVTAKKSNKRKEWNPDAWTLLAMSNDLIDEKGKVLPASPIDLRTSFLSHVLANALQRTRLRQKEHGKGAAPVIFVGMDAPELPLDEVEYALLMQPLQARLCPAADGGYGLLSIPPKVPANLVFRGVRWSQPLTAVSQLKALTDLKVPVALGQLMHDIDEPTDVSSLVQRLQTKELQQPHHHSAAAAADPDAVDEDILYRGPSGKVGVRKTTSCMYTRQALVDLGLWTSMDHRKKKVEGLTIKTRSTSSESSSSSSGSTNSSSTTTLTSSQQQQHPQQQKQQGKRRLRRAAAQLEEEEEESVDDDDLFSSPSPDDFILHHQLMQSGSCSL